MTLETLRSLIHPIPQEIKLLPKAGLCLASSSRFHVTAVQAEKGPAKTAVEKMLQHLRAAFGENCLSPEGVSVVLSIAPAPRQIPNNQEGYHLSVDAEGIVITGFGASGLLYGVISAMQLLSGCQNIPALEILDWPEDPIRGYMQESRWGSNVMEKEEWFALVDDLVLKKLNHLMITLYCCWNVQYDGRVAEYLYFPVKEYPQLQTPMLVKYFSPSQGKWIEEETLPPIFRDDLFGDIVLYAKDRGIDVVPNINSLGHNTYLPRTLPQVSPKAEDGTPTNTGFCTSSPETYQLLFSMYDQLIDTYLLPNNIRTFSIGLDEVRAEYATDPGRPGIAPEPWCSCSQCRKTSKQEQFIAHALRLITHLKEKGMDTVGICYDMLLDHPRGIGDIAQRFRDAVKDAGLEDVLLCMWWYYYDTEHRLRFRDCHDEFGLRSTANPWNGYYNWSLLTNCTKNVKLMADMKHKAERSEGMFLYSMWDKSSDRIHDYFADLGWNYAAAGSPEALTQRYSLRHFAPMAQQACHAFRLMELCTEQRKEVKGADIPAQERILSNYDTLYRLCYYPFSYFSPKQPYPRHFPGEGLAAMLPMRGDYEQQLHTIAALAAEAKAIWEQAAETQGCDRRMAQRLIYECGNYQCLCEDWLAFFQIYDLTQSGDQTQIAPIARKRQEARLAQMQLCEEVKESFILRGAAMRELSIFMQTFADIAAYTESLDMPQLDLLDITPITSPRLRSLR